jgi:hypothetical protein
MTHDDALLGITDHALLGEESGDSRCKGLRLIEN